MRRTDEIQEAVREKAKKRGLNFSTVLILITTGAVLLAVLSLLLNLVLIPRNPPNTSVKEVTTPKPSVTTPTVENILGHLPYSEADESTLKEISADGHKRLRKAAAERFLAMEQEARTEGVILIPISAFRSIKEQEYLFFKVKEQRKQETSKRAEVSAPAGYSEHHTGYAVDIGDGKAPSTNLNVNFQETAAFKWLEENANKYSFEISFPQNNVQGVSYEPWHWRFVGDQNSLETFYKAQQLNKSREAKSDDKLN